MRLSYKLLATILKTWLGELIVLVKGLEEGTITPKDAKSRLEGLVDSIGATEVDLRRYGQGEEF